MPVIPYCCEVNEQIASAIAFDRRKLGAVWSK